MAKIEADAGSISDHQDFLEIGWRSSDEPKDAFGLDHLQNTLTNEERVQSKWREKFYYEGRWNVT